MIDYISAMGKHLCTIQVIDCISAMLFGLVPLSLLLLWVMTAEVRDIVSYICSNWTKVFHTCRLLQHSEHCLPIHKWYACLLQCSCNLMKSCWDERIDQCSALYLLGPRTTPLALVRRLLHLPDQKIKLNTAVKVSIIDALQSSRNSHGGAHLSNGRPFLCCLSNQKAEMFCSACNSNSVTDVVLTWQIATSIVEVRYPL